MRVAHLLAAAVLAAAPLTLTAAAEGAAAQAPAAVPDISKADLEKAIASGKVALIDCNGSASYAKGHLPGAVDFAAHKDDLAKVLPADKSTLVVAYCGGPKCKAFHKGVDAAKQLGYTDVRHLSMGIKGWTEAGGVLAK